jgi:hypothetical protein
MNKRIKELICYITLYLKDNEIDETYITTNDDKDIWLTNLMNLTSNLSCITIESQIGESFIW